MNSNFMPSSSRHNLPVIIPFRWLPSTIVVMIFTFLLPLSLLFLSVISDDLVLRCDNGDDADSTEPDVVDFCDRPDDRAVEFRSFFTLNLTLNISDVVSVYSLCLSRHHMTHTGMTH